MARFDDVLPAAADRLIGALGAWVAPESNINFTDRPRTTAPLVAPWSPASAARLQHIRRRYDPDGLFARALLF